MIPSPFAIHQDIGSLHRDSIQVTFIVYPQLTVLVVDEPVFTQIVTLPADPVFLTIKADDLTIERRYQHALPELCKARDAKVTIELLTTIAKVVLL